MRTGSPLANVFPFLELFVLPWFCATWVQELRNVGIIWEVRSTLTTGLTGIISSEKPKRAPAGCRWESVCPRQDMWTTGAGLARFCGGRAGRSWLGPAGPEPGSRNVRGAQISWVSELAEARGECWESNPRAPPRRHTEQTRLLCHQNLGATELFEARRRLSPDRWGIIPSVYVLKAGNPLCAARGLASERALASIDTLVGAVTRTHLSERNPSRARTATWPTALVNVSAPPH